MTANKRHSRETEFIMLKKISCILLSLCFVISLASCSIRKQTTGVAVYTHDEYHFSFTRPAVFSEVESLESEENSDECDFFFKNPENGRVITLSCKFNQYKNFYEYATQSGFDKNKITCVNQNTFIYDDRDSNSPSYSLISATKRMIFKAEYKYSDKQSTADRDVCDSLGFEFDVYANTPKQNPLLSEKIYLYQDKFSVKIPANANYKLSPEQVPDNSDIADDSEEEAPSPYTDITATTKHYTASYKIAPSEKAFLKLADITAQMALVIEKAHITEVSGGLITDLTLSKGELLTCSQGNYIFVPFTCTYSKNAGYGAYAAGYSADGYFYEYTYACANDAPDGESEQFRQMLQSVAFEK